MAIFSCPNARAFSDAAKGPRVEEPILTLINSFAQLVRVEAIEVVGFCPDAGPSGRVRVVARVLTTIVVVADLLLCTLTSRQALELLAVRVHEHESVSCHTLLFGHTQPGVAVLQSVHAEIVSTGLFIRIHIVFF